MSDSHLFRCLRYPVAVNSGPDLEGLSLTKYRGDDLHGALLAIKDYL